MGKGGGKCASRDLSASSSRTPRLPALRLRKASIEASIQASKLSSKKEMVIGSDPTALVPLIPKKDQKEVLSSSHAKLDDDDGIDTNVTFDQDVDYSASDSRRRLTSVSSSEMPSVYNIANVSPARSFSSGGRSPDTLYLSGSEDLPSYKASPVHPVGMPLLPNNNDDLFLAKGAPIASSSGVAGSRSGGLRKRHSIAVSSSTMPFEARSLMTSSSFPAPRGHVEEKPLQTNVGQTIEDVAVPVAIDPHRAEASSKESLGDNWEMVSPIHQQSKGLSLEWVSVPKPIVTDMSLQVALVQGNNEVVGSQQVDERVIVEPTGESVVEPFGLASKAMPILLIVESSTQSSKASKTYDEEAETVKSVGSDQSDEIETQSINGDGGDYVLLGVTKSLPLTESAERGFLQGIDILSLLRELQKEEHKSEEQPSGLTLEQSVVPDKVAPLSTLALGLESSSIGEKVDHVEEHTTTTEEHPFGESKDLIAPTSRSKETESVVQDSRIEEAPMIEVQVIEPHVVEVKQSEMSSKAVHEDEMEIKGSELLVDVSDAPTKASAVAEEFEGFSTSQLTPSVMQELVFQQEVLIDEKVKEDNKEAEVVPKRSTEDKITSPLTIKALIVEEIKELEAPLDVAMEDKAVGVQDTDVELPFNISKSLSEKNAPALAERALAHTSLFEEPDVLMLQEVTLDVVPIKKISTLVDHTMIGTLSKLEIPILEHHSLPVDSSTLDLASPVEEVPAITMATLLEESSSTKLTNVEQFEAPMVDASSWRSFGNEIGSEPTSASEVVPIAEAYSPTKVKVDEATPMVEEMELPPCVDEAKVPHLVEEKGEATSDAKDHKTLVALSHESLLFNQDVAPTPIVDEEICLAPAVLEVAIPDLDYKTAPTSIAEDEIAPSPVVEDETASVPIVEDEIAPPITKDEKAPTSVVEDIAFAPVGVEEGDPTLILQKEATSAPVVEGKIASPSLIADQTSKSEDNSWKSFKQEIENELVPTSYGTPIATALVGFDEPDVVMEEKDLSMFVEELHADQESPSIAEEETSPSSTPTPIIEEEALPALVLGKEAIATDVVGDGKAYTSIVEVELTQVPAPISEEKTEPTTSMLEKEATPAGVVEEESALIYVIEDKGVVVVVAKDEATLAPVVKEHIALDPMFEKESSYAPIIQEDVAPIINCFRR